MLTHKMSIRDYINKFGGKGVGFSVSVVKLPKDDYRYISWRESLKNRNTSWSKGYTKETHSSVAKIAETFRKKRIDNFAKWRDEARRSGVIPKLNNPLDKNKDLAFLIGLILGDGNIHKFLRTEGLRITLATKYPNLWKYAAEVVGRVFNKEPSVRKVKNSECMTISIYQKGISRRLEIPSGKRGKLAIKLPDWIWQDRNYLRACIRGLFEAEGSFSIHKPTYTYNLCFSNNNPSLLDEVEKAIKIFGFHPERRTNAVRLRKKKETYDFIDLIGFRQYN